MRIRYADEPGLTPGYSIRDPAGLWLDMASPPNFTATPTERIAGLAAGTGILSGEYSAAPDSSAFPDGDYLIGIHDGANQAAATRELAIGFAAVKGGSDATVFPGPGGVDPLAVVVPATYAPNTVGWLVGHYLDAAVSAAGGAADPAAIVSAVFAKAIGPLTFGDIARIIGAFGGGRISRDGQGRIHISEAGGTADVIVMVQTTTGRTITLYL